MSPFINNLPKGKDTVSFVTENASGSTSQAAGIIEALEIGTDLLLIDEDTSATNFMIRDGRMQRLVQKEMEPITPFIDRVKALYKQKQVSTVLVIGGSGDYFDVADHVIMMEEYVPKDVTEQVKEIIERMPNTRKSRL
ncbi:MAG: P-loop domain-containing protein [Tepidanaerobacteraceae bacterium]